MTFAEPPKPSMSGASTRWFAASAAIVCSHAEFRADAELAAVQQDHRITLARLEIGGDEAVHQDGPFLCTSWAHARAGERKVPRHADS